MQYEDIDWQKLIKEDHRQREIASLNAGNDGCGCLDCQELYREIDTAQYGNRVRHMNDTIIISARLVTKTKKLPDEEVEDPIPDRPKKAQKQKETCNKPPPAVLIIEANVTALEPVKDLVDSFIKTARAKDKRITTRTIAGLLEEKQVHVSHMFIHRRIVEMKKQGVMVNA